MVEANSTGHDSAILCPSELARDVSQPTHRSTVSAAMAGIAQHPRADGVNSRCFLIPQRRPAGIGLVGLRRILFSRA